MKSRRCLAPAAVLLLALSVDGAAFASGGAVLFKTDNGPDGYFYNANGAARARYCAFYAAGELPPGSVLCGIRHRSLDQSTVTSGVDDYVLGGDLRSEDANNPGYADLGPGGLIALGDPASLTICSSTGVARTITFGGGAGVPGPMTQFVLTCRQPANANPALGIDFCGILLDTSSAFQNSARTQAYSLADGPLFGSVGFNHFVEAVLFAEVPQEVNARFSGSPRFPADAGLPVMFARRACDPAQPNCLAVPGDAPVSTTDDFITARITLDNNTCSPVAANLDILAVRAAINPKLGPRVVTGFFTACGGGPGIMNPLTLPAKSRTSLCLEVRAILGRNLVGRLPIDLPFMVNLVAPAAPVPPLASSFQTLGLRPSAGYYDNDGHAGGFFFSASPVLTGDSMIVRYDAIDLENRAHTPTPHRVQGLQIVGGDFGASGLPGLDAVELRDEDPVLVGSPDLTPGGLRRAVSVVGDPGNADGIPFGPPATTVNIDFTDVVTTPVDFAVSRNLFALAYLNPGDTAMSVTAIGTALAPNLLVGNSRILFGATVPGVPLIANDLEIRLDHGGELGNPANLQGPRTKVLTGALLRAGGRYIAIDDDGNLLEDREE